jgi:hypothetical protein
VLDQTIANENLAKTEQRKNISYMTKPISYHRFSCRKMLKIQGNQDLNHQSIINKTHHSKCKNLDQQSREWMSPTVSHATAATINFPMSLLPRAWNFLHKCALFQTLLIWKLLDEAPLRQAPDVPILPRPRFNITFHIYEFDINQRKMYAFDIVVYYDKLTPVDIQACSI